MPVIKDMTAYHDPEHDSFEELGFDDPGENISDDPFIMVSFEISDSSLEDYSVCLSNNILVLLPALLKHIFMQRIL